jgi:hypothetical protein
MCGGDCPCDGSGCGGCEYGCWGAMSDGKCVWPGCCDKPPPTCGCCLTWDSSDASCLNDTYYITFPINEAIFYNNINYTQGYIVFTFENCLSCTSGSAISTKQGIYNFMVWWYQCMIIQAGYSSGNEFTSACSSLTTTKPDSSFLNISEYYNGGNCCDNINYAEHCYFWPEEVDGTITNWTGTNPSNPSGLAFTSYCLDNCDFVYPLYTPGTCMY